MTEENQFPASEGRTKLMKLVVGCEIDEFKSYYNKTVGTFDGAEEYWVTKDPSHLIVWLT